ncbi:hypothetical protein FRP1_13930 [Pseudonocardia sp. EC080625-04]|nr:hypothetical protein FRP1_13930 [Pseudonocardia sp. EC080625-04]
MAGPAPGRRRWDVVSAGTGTLHGRIFLVMAVHGRRRGRPWRRAGARVGGAGGSGPGVEVVRSGGAPARRVLIRKCRS